MSLPGILRRLALSVVMIPLPGFAARAQDSTVAAPPAERVLSSGVYSEQQAGRGEGVYRTVCQSCHAKTEYTGDKFKLAWVTKTVYDIFDSIRTLMPDDNPGSLERQEYIDVVAYIFALNAYPAGPSDLPTDDDGLKKVRIDNPPGSLALRQRDHVAAHPRVSFRK